MDTLNAPPTASRPLPASAAPLHPREFERLASVCGLAVCDRGVDPTLDEIAQRAATLFGVPCGLVTLLTETEQIYLGNHAVPGVGTPREQAICAHTILQDEPFVVDDLLEDERFAGLDIAIRDPFVRFYAGAPVRDRYGLPLGSLCVLGCEPRTPTMRHLSSLARLAQAAGVVLEARRLVADLVLRPEGRAPLDLCLLRVDRILASIPSLVSGPGL